MDVGWSLFVSRQPRRRSPIRLLIRIARPLHHELRSHSYPFLRATNRLVGALSTRGFDYRMVQADVYAGNDNTIAKGEAQLAIPSEFPYDRTWRN